MVGVIDTFAQARAAVAEAYRLEPMASGYEDQAGWIVFVEDGRTLMTIDRDDTIRPGNVVRIVEYPSVVERMAHAVSVIDEGGLGPSGLPAPN